MLNESCQSLSAEGIYELKLDFIKPGMVIEWIEFRSIVLCNSIILIFLLQIIRIRREFMVGSSSIITLIIAMVICFLFPIAFAIYFKLKHKISLKPVFTGVAVFIIFVLILEQILHFFVLQKGLITNPILITVYGALAIVFEERKIYSLFNDPER